eukprot:scaffold122053_cov63-Phaeocystis_antarctica.AAC.2
MSPSEGLKVGRFAGLPVARASAAKDAKDGSEGVVAFCTRRRSARSSCCRRRAIRSSARFAWRVPTGSSSTTTGLTSRYHDSAMSRGSGAGLRTAAYTSAVYQRGCNAPTTCYTGWKPGLTQKTLRSALAVAAAAVVTRGAVGEALKVHRGLDALAARADAYVALLLSRRLPVKRRHGQQARRRRTFEALDGADAHLPLEPQAGRRELRKQAAAAEADRRRARRRRRRGWRGRRGRAVVGPAPHHEQRAAGPQHTRELGPVDWREAAQDGVERAVAERQPAAPRDGKVGGALPSRAEPYGQLADVRAPQLHVHLR